MSAPTEAQKRALVAACATSLRKIEQWTATHHANVAACLVAYQAESGLDFTTESGGTNK